MSRPMRQRLLFHVAALLLAISTAPEAFSIPPQIRNSLASMQETHRKYYQEFTDDLNALILFCEGKTLEEAVLQIRLRLVPLDTESAKLPALPHETQEDSPLRLNSDNRYWQTQLRHHQKEYAKKLFLLSRRALKDNPSYAYQLVREAAIHDPDHRQLRKVLGFVQLGNEWMTPFAYDQIKKGNEWHEQYGWIPKNQLERIAAGERNFKGSWVSSAKENELRRNFSDGWQIRTDHYLIKTNYSLERGVELGKSLEEFHEFFNETFASFFNTPEQMKKLFDETARSVRLDARPYCIHYYRSREEYLNRLKKQFPTIEQTNGVYMTNDRVVHFYHEPNATNEGTLFHEATHQLFFESQGQSRPIGEQAHFWIIEGIACYMESFICQNGVVTVGDPKYIRFCRARANLLSEKNHYLPLRLFAGWGMKEFQHSPDLTKNYAQASGLARFLMHYENGRYRESLVAQLTSLYSGDVRVRENTKGLDLLTGVDYEELDRQYIDDSRQLERSVMNP